MADLVVDEDVLGQVERAVRRAHAAFHCDVAASMGGVFGAAEVDDAFGTAVSSITRMTNWLRASTEALGDQATATVVRMADTDATLASR